VGRLSLDSGSARRSSYSDEKSPDRETDAAESCAPDRRSDAGYCDIRTLREATDDLRCACAERGDAFGFWRLSQASRQHSTALSST
jgi:hypothetical protein